MDETILFYTSNFVKIQHQVRSPKMNNSTDAPVQMDTKCLYVKGLWEGCTQKEFNELLKGYGTIVQSRIYGDGAGFVCFESAEEANEAIKALNGSKSHPKCFQPLFVNFAFRKVKQKQPLRMQKKSKETQVVRNIKNVYVRCLPYDYTEKDLYDLCSQFGIIACMRLSRKGFAFVRFLEIESAQLCIQKLNGKILQDCAKPLMVKYANSDPFEARLNIPKVQQNQNHSNLSFFANMNNSSTTSNNKNFTSNSQFVMPDCNIPFQNNLSSTFLTTLGNFSSNRLFFNPSMYPFQIYLPNFDPNQPILWDASNISTLSPTSIAQPFLFPSPQNSTNCSL